MGVGQHTSAYVSIRQNMSADSLLLHAERKTDASVHRYRETERERETERDRERQRDRDREIETERERERDRRTLPTQPTSCVLSCGMFTMRIELHYLTSDAAVFRFKRVIKI